MANPNPKDPNVLNEDVPEEDPYHLLDYDEEEDPEMDIEEDDPVEEPEPLAGHGDQFDAHPNPQPGNINGWVDDDDDAEIIFPYEVQGDRTPPPRDESSDFDSEPEAEKADDEPEAEEADDELEVEEAGDEPEAEGTDVELEVEEPDGAPEATMGTGKVVERLKVLESEENATLKKKLAEKEALLDLTHMERDRPEKRLSESIW
nr:hypothetical protein [Tanacetum cinerariifolium]